MEPRLRSVGSQGRVQTDDGLLWKRHRSATSTAEEFVDARTLFIQIHEDAEWNPWVLDDRAPEIERAMAVMQQWQRAEPGFRLRQLDDIEAEWAEEDEARAAWIAEERQARERRKADYDPGLEQARLVLLELEGWLAMERFQRQGLIEETLLPSMDADGRADRVRECDREIAACQRRLDEIRDAVADPERVIDPDGYLPAERRELSLSLFASRRQTAVRDLRPKIIELSVALDGTRGRKERAEARKQLADAQALLDDWLQVPALSAEDMCSECPQPTKWHSTRRLTPIGWQGPCPAWPAWRERIQKARAFLVEAASKREQPETARPEPLRVAVIPSSLPITEVTSRLTELQAQYPDAEVRRGRGNSWELWSVPPGSPGAS